MDDPVPQSTEATPKHVDRRKFIFAATIGVLSLPIAIRAFRRREAINEVVSGPYEIDKRIPLSQGTSTLVDMKQIQFAERVDGISARVTFEAQGEMSPDRRLRVTLIGKDNQGKTVFRGTRDTMDGRVAADRAQRTINRSSPQSYSRLNTEIFTVPREAFATLADVEVEVAER